jgi:GntR family transcriptional repressor for pyruvate dehydrogenase complex
MVTSSDEGGTLQPGLTTGEPPLRSSRAASPWRRTGPRLLTEEVAQRLGDRILSGQLKPNDQLSSERELAVEYGVSRTVIRGALAVLSERGLVESRPGRGTYVCNGSARATASYLSLLVGRDHITLVELIEARFFLETRVAHLAAQRADAADVQALEQALISMDETRAQPTAFVEADLAFHEALARAAQNRVLLSFLECIRDVLSEGMRLGIAVPGSKDASIAEHRAIVIAVRARDVDAAERAMGEHLRSSYRQQVLAGYTSTVPDTIDWHAPDGGSA